MPFLPFTSVKRTPRPVKAKDREHLIELIGEEMERSGHECSLNHIDVSEVTSMSAVFEEHPTFNGDISQWNTSKVEYMNNLFSDSRFNGDISKWDVSNVAVMTNMFSSSRFNGDISGWDTSNVRSMFRMFSGSHFQGDIRRWDVSKVVSMQ